MRARQLLAGLSAVALASPLLAQTPECSAHAGNAERVCTAAVDATRAFHPLFGMLVSGGNPTIGSAATLGGFGHASLTIRANATEGYRTYSRQTVDDAPDWRVEVRSANGDLLHERRFAVR